jgi:hypothetical protein
MKFSVKCLSVLAPEILAAARQPDFNQAAFSADAGSEWAHRKELLDFGVVGE